MCARGHREGQSLEGFQIVFPGLRYSPGQGGLLCFILWVGDGFGEHTVSILNSLENLKYSQKFGGSQ